MRYRLMATYQGVPYEAGIGPSEGDVVLFAACPPPEELGFEPATGHWRKQLRVADVQALWESRPTGAFRGERCIILDDLGDRLHIAFLGHDAYKAEQLGYWQVDRGVFELVTPRDEVVEIAEERTDYPQRSATAPPSPAPPLPPEPPPPAPQPAPPGSGSISHPGFGAAAPPGFHAAPAPGPVAPQPYLSPAADTAGPADIAMPPYQEPPLPLEAAALRATSIASRIPSPAPELAAQQSRAAGLSLLDLPAPQQQAGQQQAGQHQAPQHQAPQHQAGQPAPESAGPPAARPRRGARQRVATHRVFSELANLAAIPAASYAVGAEVDGAMCLLQAEGGFEVFNAVGGARHEVRLFGDEESAYFYLFGVLAAEAVRTGGLVPHG